MESETRKEETILLTLTVGEAMWLKGLVQNQLVQPTLLTSEEEPKKNKQMRETFWNALKDVDPLQ